MSVFLSQRGGILSGSLACLTRDFITLHARDLEHTDSGVSEVVPRCDKVSDSPVTGGVSWRRRLRIDWLNG